MRRRSRGDAPGPEEPPKASGGARPYASSLEHLLDEMGRVELLIRRAADAARKVAGDDPYRGLSISEDDARALLNRSFGEPIWRSVSEPDEISALLEQKSALIEERLRLSEQAGMKVRLGRLAELFHLGRIDVDIILIGLAAELDTRYERLFAYLNDDVTRRRPTVDVALGLLFHDLLSRIAGRSHFADAAPLLRGGLIHLFADPPSPHPTLLSSAFRVDARIVNYLQGSDALDPRVAPHARLVAPSIDLGDLQLPKDLGERIARFIDQEEGSRLPGAVASVFGPRGAGRRSLVEAMARGIGRSLLIVDLGSIDDGERLAALIPLAAREARLLDAALLWEDAGRVINADSSLGRAALLRSFLDMKLPVFLTADSAWVPSEELRDRRVISIELGVPSFLDQAAIWSTALGEARDESIDLAALAGRYRLTPGQIHDAAASAKGLARFGGRERPSLQDLTEACRLHGNRALAGLADKIEPKHTFQDLVLPKDRADRLREALSHARQRVRVLEGWGFERKLSTGKGLSMLFSGPPGTGKTLAASVMARELDLDLYRIDLSRVVSKYIGETEKQLSRIFSEAERSHSILFFDEADALFGKRSEVQDAHDRYANIEVSYLLQRMESYEGVVILATNFSRNMDEAFVRRLHFILDFTLPVEAERLAIWQKIWPESAPMAADVDLAFLAARFELAGGHIRNIALAAAMLAAADGGPVTMKHLLHATRREHQKLGKVMDDRAFTYP